MINDCPISEVTSKSLEEAFTSKKPFLITYLDDWCPACQEFKPVVEYYAERYSDVLDFFVIRSEDPASDSLMSLLGQVDSIPCTWLMLGSEVLTRIPGAMRFSHMGAVIKTHAHSFCK